MTALLEQWGCVVLAATDQDSALQLLGEQAPELILADFHLDHGAVGSQVGAALASALRQQIFQRS